MSDVIVSLRHTLSYLGSLAWLWPGQTWAAHGRPSRCMCRAHGWRCSFPSCYLGWNKRENNSSWWGGSTATETASVDQSSLARYCCRLVGACVFLFSHKVYPRLYGWGREHGIRNSISPLLHGCCRSMRFSLFTQGIRGATAGLIYVSIRSGKVVASITSPCVPPAPPHL